MTLDIRLGHPDILALAFRSRKTRVVFEWSGPGSYVA